MEIWNLVFIQEQVDGDLEVVAPLPGKNVDTGSSLERVAMVLQGVDNVFETDLFQPHRSRWPSGCPASATARTRSDDVSLKIVAEHGRATTFLIADGVQPSNEGRGYILRRMLRRAVSHARRLGIEGSVLDPIITTVIDGFGDAYPELRENEAFVRQVADSEEGALLRHARQGAGALRRGEGSCRGRRASPATMPSRSPTRSASLGSRSRSGRARAASASTSTASRSCWASSAIARGRRARRWRSASRPARCRRPSSSATATCRPSRRSR